MIFTINLNYIRKTKKVYIDILKRSCTCLVVPHPEKVFIIKSVL